MLRIGFTLLLVFTLFFGGIYPCAAYLIGRVFFPFQAGGSLLFHPKTQTIIGSQLIGQPFTSAIYFHPRPSMTPEGEYNAAQSQGSHHSVCSDSLHTEILGRAERYRQLNGLTEDTCIPMDAVTASASGLDPHISITNALLQAPRVAKGRGIPEEEVHTYIEKWTERPFFGLLGETRINVLMLNLALDHASVEKEE